MPCRSNYRPPPPRIGMRIISITNYDLLFTGFRLSWSRANCYLLFPFLWKPGAAPSPPSKIMLCTLRPSRCKISYPSRRSRLVRTLCRCTVLRTIVPLVGTFFITISSAIRFSHRTDKFVKLSINSVSERYNYVTYAKGDTNFELALRKKSLDFFLSVRETCREKRQVEQLSGVQFLH